MFAGAILALLAALTAVTSAVNCGDKTKTCELCMAKGPPCMWCYDPDFSDRDQGPEHRCAELSELLDRGCSSNYTLNTASDFTVGRNDSPIETPKKTIQLYPQKMNVRLRPNEPLTVTVGYQQALNYPVDLYYLTDMSYSMYKHLAVVSQQAQKIADTMTNLTTKFRIGFGTFVDKPVHPFVDPRPKAMQNPCQGVSDKVAIQCDPPYGYRHVLSMTTDIRKFQATTNSTKPSGNLDGPEGGLDALVQAALCDETVGWNSQARKIVLFTTDAGFHLAGDGRLGGVIRRFEEKCNMRRLGSGISVYDKSAVLDYPSVGQVARALESKGIGVIFAITGELFRLYLNLANILPSAAVGVLEGDSDNIASLIRDNYNQISSSIGLTAHIPDDRVKVRVTPICPNDTRNKSSEDTGPRSVKMCHGLPLGGKVQFKVELEASACLEKPVNVTLKPTNLEGEVVVLNVETSCSCAGKCGGVITPAPQCSGGKGNLSCGVCSCNPGSSGDFCECSADTVPSVAACVSPTGTADQVCSGRGRCECGSCRCYSERYRGPLCGCDLRACPRASDDGSVCGGLGRGSCNCNRSCTCRPGYKGAACDCLISQAFCRASTAAAPNATADDAANSTEPLCSGHGTCDCGLCVCEADWTGLTCSEPRGGTGRLCQVPSMQECVLCLLAKRLGEDDVADLNCDCRAPMVDEKLVTFVEEHDKKDVPSLCVVYDRSDCRVYFTYRYESAAKTERRLLISVQRTRECPDRTSVILIVVAVILFVVILGILLLVLWKVCVTIHDRRAMADTIKVEDQALFEAGENPIYQPPITTVHNPLCESPKVT